MICPICNATSDSFASATILGKYKVGYFQCSKCGFIHTEKPYWLKEAYSSAITGSDVGLVQRNSRLTTIVRVLVSVFFDSKGQYLDFAGGYGLFVRMMRDSGLDFYWFDRYCKNLFAGEFVADLNNDRRYELITAFEVFEHMIDPVSGLDEIMNHSRNILFTTNLLPEPAPMPNEWWYYGIEHGQHISFYTRKSLQVLAEKKGLNYYSNGATMHLLTEKMINAPLFFLLARYRTARLIAPLLMKKSLLEDDFRNISGRELL